MFRVNADTLETYVDFDFSFVRFDDLNLATVSALLAEADQIFNTDHRKRIPTRGAVSEAGLLILQLAVRRWPELHHCLGKSSISKFAYKAKDQLKFARD